MTDAAFRLEQDSNCTNDTPSPRTIRVDRWKRDSNRDDDNPSYDSTSKDSQSSHKQQKRIIIVFGDGSFSPNMPGKLSANFRDIRKKLKEKSKMLGVFPPSHPIPELRGKRRLVVLDIDEYKTSRNYSDPTLPPNSTDYVSLSYCIIN